MAFDNASFNALSTLILAARTEDLSGVSIVGTLRNKIYAVYFNNKKSIEHASINCINIHQNASESSALNYYYLIHTNTLNN